MIEFTVEELTDIYFMLHDYGVNNSYAILSKIEQKYTFCWFCNQLILNENFESHQNTHFDDDE